MKKKSTAFKVIITILIVLIVLIIAAGIFVFSKLHSLNNSINHPLNRDHSQLRQKSLKDGDPMTVVLYGIDDDSRRHQENMGQRSDSIVLMSINPKDKKTVMVSVPRDTRAEMVGRNTTEKINHAYAYGGPKMAVNSLEKLMNVPVDHYIAINMDGVKTVVDEIGGVTVASNATFNTTDSKKDYKFEQGKEYNMDGEEALAYMRSRKDEGAGGDEGRQLRQQQVITAVAKEAFSINSITKLNGIFKAAQDNLKTDLSFVQLNSFKSDYDKAQDNVERLTIDGQNKVGDDGLYYFYPDKNSMNEVEKKIKDNLEIN
ncbi:LytR family transcriptional regulator [Staphylococcus pragensis]|uniref:LytR family transcriptional regulator n=1 Tax=Staphylococcus pragensis TaxID=1611836 RepID=A0A4Z1B8L8_9STAP|nr:MULTISPECIES: LCP family protein [Staphylococcus]RTX89661.1 LytR family transcriptional regulator [Staphylococcus carnosus]TGN24664.1 LytR family transcriptional regulator [Staphylococcus pragensis]GGG95821.1 transcriptional regulator [Staphylococcus pragensis]